MRSCPACWRSGIASLSCPIDSLRLSPNVTACRAAIGLELLASTGGMAVGVMSAVGCVRSDPQGNHLHRLERGVVGSSASSREAQYIHASRLRDGHALGELGTLVRTVASSQTSPARRPSESLQGDIWALPCQSSSSSSVIQSWGTRAWSLLRLQRALTELRKGSSSRSACSITITWKSPSRASIVFWIVL